MRTMLNKTALMRGLVIATIALLLGACSAASVTEYCTIKEVVSEERYEERTTTRGYIYEPSELDPGCVEGFSELFRQEVVGDDGITVIAILVTCEGTIQFRVAEVTRYVTVPCRDVEYCQTETETTPGFFRTISAHCVGFRGGLTPARQSVCEGLGGTWIPQSQVWVPPVTKMVNVPCGTDS